VTAFAPIRTIALTLALILGAGIAAQAQDLPTTTNFKIGVVDRSRVFEAYEKQEAELGKIQAAKEGREKELQAEIDKLEARLQTYTGNREGMTPEQREKFEVDFKADERGLQQKKENYQSELADRTARVIRDLRGDIDEAIQAIGNQENYHLILDTDRDPRAQSNVVYFSTTIDLTGRVIERLNSEYKGGSQGD
jgi:Skp family chaperone for outer membrane proteins